MDNRIALAQKYKFMKHTIVLGGSQFTRCIPLSKRVTKIKNQAGYLNLTFHLEKSGPM